MNAATARRLPAFALLAAWLFAMGGCGGGTDADELPCGWDYVGPILPGHYAPGCEPATAAPPTTPRAGVDCTSNPEQCI